MLRLVCWHYVKAKVIQIINVIFLQMQQQIIRISNHCKKAFEPTDKGRTSPKTFTSKLVGFVHE